MRMENLSLNQEEGIWEKLKGRHLTIKGINKQNKLLKLDRVWMEFPKQMQQAIYQQANIKILNFLLILILLIKTNITN